MRAAQCFLGRVAFHAFGAQVNQHHVGVGATGHDVQTALHQLISQRNSVRANLFLVVFELGAQRLAESDSLGCDHVHQGAALNAREDGRVDLFRDIFVVGQDHATTRTAQGFVGGGGGHVGIGERAGVFTRSNQTGKVGHVDHQVGTNAVGDFAHLGEIHLTRDGRTTCDDQLGLVFGSQSLNLIIVDQAVLLAHAILNGVEPFARLVGLGAVGQVAAGIQRHTQNGVTRLQQRGENTLVCLAARVRLNVCEITTEQLLGAVDRQIFGDVDILATAVIAAARITFGVLVGHDRALGFHHSGRNDVFGRNQLDLVALAAQFIGDRLVQFGIARGERFGEETGIGHSCAPSWRLDGA